MWSRKTVKNWYKPDQTAQNPREVTVETNFLMNVITHFFQPPAYVFFIFLDFWGHRFAALQKTAEIDFQLRGRHVGKPHYVLRVRKIRVRPTTATHLLRYQWKHVEAKYACRSKVRDFSGLKRSFLKIWGLKSVRDKTLKSFFFLTSCIELHDKRPRKSRNKVVYFLNKIENKPGHCGQTIKILNGHSGRGFKISYDFDKKCKISCSSVFG